MTGFQQNGARNLAIVAPAAVEARWHERLREAFLGMVAGVTPRPQPRWIFDSQAAADADQRGRAPWQTICTAFRAAVGAGAKRDQVLRFVEEMYSYVISLYPPIDDLDLVATLIAEADADAQSDPAQTRALRSHDRATLERLILTNDAHIKRLQDVNRAALLRLCGAQAPVLSVMR